MFSKDTNPKDAVGVRKVPMSTVPANVLMEIGAAMLEGARKYGRHNYRQAGVRASVYYDGLMRHMMAWWEGQDIDPDSGLNHVTKAIATLVVLRDAMLNDMLVDDRPPKVKDAEWLATLNQRCGGVIDRYPDPKEPITELGLDGNVVAGDINPRTVMVAQKDYVRHRHDVLGFNLEDPDNKDFAVEAPVLDGRL